MGRLHHRFGKGPRGIEEMAVHADIELAPVDAFQPEPIDEHRRIVRADRAAD